jgi:hypothetical protein
MITEPPRRRVRVMASADASRAAAILCFLLP